jgi:hypothetical protein
LRRISRGTSGPWRTRTLARPSKGVIKQLTLTDVHRSEFDWVCAVLDALAACKLGRAVGPEAVPVEFIRAAGTFYMRLVAQACKAAAATGALFYGWTG